MNTSGEESMENMFNNTSILIEDIDNGTFNGSVTYPKYRLPGDAPIRIGLYSIIFIMTVVGNALVIITLVQNKRMRTVTNLFLLNLAISDLLIGVFCMPVSLTGSLLRNFIFGPVMCYLIPFCQAVAVSVSVWTLVVISLERYFAICRPLHSRRWQTVSHAYRVVAAIWVGSLLSMIPIICFSKLKPTSTPGKYKCREEWPTIKAEQTYNIYLDITLLLIPLIIMCTTYVLISKTLWIGIRVEVPKKSNFRYSEKNNKKIHVAEPTNAYEVQCNGMHYHNEIKSINHPKQSGWIVQGNSEKNREAKKRVIRMLFVVVIEFFICWTPLYIINTWYLFENPSISPLGMSIIHLMSYLSCCCNPVTYCFMHKKFRQGFINVIRCNKRKRWQSTRSSDCSATLNSIYSTRVGSMRTEMLDRIEDDTV